MKSLAKYIIFILAMSSQLLIGQSNDLFLDNYYARKKYYPEKAKEYKDIAGSPYLNSEFVEGTFYLKDTVAIKLPLRYNIYSDEMEYMLKGINYVVGNPQSLNKIELGGSLFVYLPFVGKGGYFELFELGKCTLVQKKLVEIKPAEGPKPMEPEIKPASFIRKSDIFFLVINDSLAFKIENMKSVKKALQDQKDQIESFIKQEKIKNIKKGNLIKIVKYYNSL